MEQNAGEWQGDAERTAISNIMITPELIVLY